MNELGKKGIPFLFILDYGGREGIVQALQEVDPRRILYSVRGISNAAPPDPDLKRAEMERYPMSYPEYLQKFNRVRQELQKGNSYLLNLTAATPVRLNLDLREIFYRTTAPYRLWIRDKFVVFSPETFVVVDDGIISTYPMKGTISEAVSDAERSVLEDVKEAAEHATITDLLRNDLSRVAAEVEVVRYRYVERIRTQQGGLLQVSSEIRGKLPDDYRSRLGDIIGELLPAGSVTGAPKQKTVEILNAVEGYDRGFYTGVFGIFDGKRLISAVSIRFIEQTVDGYVYKSGGGITFMSEPEKEYEELIDKIYLPVVS
jgi:para-aminobenzoate synthetase component 1